MNTLTVEEAKKKKCHNAILAENRFGHVFETRRKCMGDECMAWQWVTEEIKHEIPCRKCGGRVDLHDPTFIGSFHPSGQKCSCGNGKEYIYETVVSKENKGKCGRLK